MSAKKSSSISAFAGAAIAALALIAAGCSGQSHNGSAGLPAMLPDAPAAAAPAAAAPAAVPAAKGSTWLVGILALAAPGNGKPVVALGLEIDGKAKSFTAVNIAASNSACKKHGKTFTCKVSMETTSGAHWLTVDGYTAPLTHKKPPAPVSSNGLLVNSVKATTQVLLSLNSSPAAIAIVTAQKGVTGNVTSGFTVDRSVASGLSAFALYAVDADGRAVVGPDTANFTVKGSNPQLAIATPDPNQFTLDASTVVTAASTKISASAKGTACPKQCKLSFSVAVSALSTPTPSPSPGTSPTASPSPGTSPTSSPTPASTATPTPIATATPTPTPTGTPTPMPSPTTTPAIYISYSTGASTGAVRAFDIQGHTRPLSGSWANLGQPSSIGYDTTNSSFYLLTAGASAPIASYDVLGNQNTLAGSFTMTPMGLAVDNTHNHLYVPTHVGMSNDTILGYDAQGNALSLSPGFSSSLVPASQNAIAWDPDHSKLYIVNSSTEKIEAYDTQGNSIDISTKFGQPTPCASACVPTAIAYAHFDKWPYVIWKTGSSYYIGVYSGSGGYLGYFTPTMDTPVAIASDDLDSRIYVVGAAGDVEGTDEFGTTPQTLAGNFTPVAGGTATGIAIIPQTAAPSARRATLKRKPGHPGHPR